MKSKKIIAFICAVSLVGNVVFSGYHADSLSNSVVTVNAEALTYEDFSYEVTENGEVTITEYKGEAAEVVIPSEIDGYKVTSIGSYAFSECNNLESITMPDGVTSIGEWAFSGCSSLESITIPKSVAAIDGLLFGFFKPINITIYGYTGSAADVTVQGVLS